MVGNKEERSSSKGVEVGDGTLRVKGRSGSEGEERKVWDKQKIVEKVKSEEHLRRIGVR